MPGNQGDTATPIAAVAVFAPVMMGQMSVDKGTGSGASQVDV
jgi:hypothetical protein